MDTAGSQIVLPGIKDPDTLQALSTECGTVSMREHGPGALHAARGDDAGMIRSLPAKRALVVRGNRAPVICKVRQVWSDRLHKRARHEPAAGTDLQAGRTRRP